MVNKDNVWDGAYGCHMPMCIVYCVCFLLMFWKNSSADTDNWTNKKHYYDNTIETLKPIK